MNDQFVLLCLWWVISHEQADAVFFWCVC